MIARRKGKAKAERPGIPGRIEYRIEVAVDDKRFRREISGLKDFCFEICVAAIAVTPLAKHFFAIEINLMLANDETVRGLNHQFRGKDKPTNVLSFPLEELNLKNYRKFTPDFVMLGDIVVAYETVKREAATQGKKFSDHLRHLLIHAALHLAGYDHGKQMEKLEIEVLKRYGINNPYII